MREIYIAEQKPSYLKEWCSEIFDVRWCNRTRNELIRNELIEENMPLVKALIMKWFKNPDLFSSGYCGLIKAVDKYNPRLNIKFSAYAKKFIYYAAIDEFEFNNKIIVEPRHSDSLSYEQIDDEIHQPVFDASADGDCSYLDDNLLSSLNEQQQTVIRCKYQYDMTRKDIAELLDVSPSRINAIEKKALDKLKSII